jgi:zinc transport system ATP-binding protein
MLGVVDRLGGDVEWFGQRGHETVRSRVGYVPQRQSAAGPIPVTVAELVQSGRVGGAGWWRRQRASDRAAVNDAIAVVGLDDDARTPLSQLSGGQQRRAMVARGLASGADVLILDEPLAGVDAASQAALADTLGTLAGAGTTVVIVLHELGPIGPLVTRIVHMNAGVVSFDGPLAEAPMALLHVDHDDDPHGGVCEPPTGMGLFGR